MPFIVFHFDRNWTELNMTHRQIIIIIYVYIKVVLNDNIQCCIYKNVSSSCCVCICVCALEWGAKSTLFCNSLLFLRYFRQTSTKNIDSSEFSMCSKKKWQLSANIHLTLTWDNKNILNKAGFHAILGWTTTVLEIIVGGQLPPTANFKKFKYEFMQRKQVSKKWWISSIRIWVKMNYSKNTCLTQ